MRSRSPTRCAMAGSATPPSTSAIPSRPTRRTTRWPALPNVLQTPHMAATSREAAEDLHRLAAQYILEMLESAGRISAVA